MFKKKEPSLYPKRWGKYIIDYENPNLEVSITVCLKETGTKAYVRFAKGKNFKNVKGPVYSDINLYLQKHNYSKLSSHKILKDKLK